MPARSQTGLLTVREAARRLSVHENTVRNWSNKGLLEPVQLPGSRYRRFRAADVDRLARTQELASARTARTVAAEQLVDADFLDQWASSREAHQLLPQVVRRLVGAAPHVRGLTMRAGGGVGAPGWDALIEDGAGTPWVPLGHSAWEMGTGADPERKAQDDYDKRTADPLGVDRATTTFVFVTPRRWTRARDWERARRADGHWHDVRVLDADDLAAWLEVHPATLMWISERVGLQPLEVRTLNEWWAQFRVQTRPALPAALLTAGRDDAGGKLRQFLAGPPAIVGLRAGSRDESLGFLAAAVEQGLLLQDTPVLLALSSQAWERLCLWEERAVLVPPADGASAARALERGHHVVAPLAAGDAEGNHAVVELPAIDRMLAREALEAEGLPSRSADRLAVLARRSLAALTRDPEIAVGPQRGPDWTTSAQARLLGLLVLAGSWTADAAEDEAVVAALAARPWHEVEHELVRWATSADPPFTRSGGCWEVVSPDGSWTLLNHAVQPADLRRMVEQAIEVLGTPDPMASAGFEERLAADLRGRPPGPSSTLRRGIAQGLALVGAFPLKNGTSGADHAARAVGELLARANGDLEGQLWASLSEVLPLLAEAAPNAFLTGVEDGLAPEILVLRTMFRDGGEGFSALTASSPHTGLLWSLELLCWSPEHLPRAAHALARLAELDPGGRLSNRPGGSLRRVFLPWIPRTSATLEQRMRVIDGLRRRHPDVAWKLLMALMPERHGASFTSPTPRFRAWMPAQEGVSVTEWLGAIKGLSERAVEDAGQDPQRWVEVIGHLANLPPEQLDRILDAVEALPVAALPHGGRVALWEALTEFVGRHRKFPDARWALSAEPLARLDTVARTLEPQDPVERHAWLFDWRPHLPGVDADDYETHQRLLSEARTAAVSETLGAGGERDLERLAASARLQEAVGWHVAIVCKEQFAARAIELLGDHTLGQFAAGWVRGMLANDGRQWISRFAAGINHWSERAQTGLLLALGGEESVLPLLNAAGADARNAYWHAVNPAALLALNPQHAVDELLAHGRPWAAIDYLAFLRAKGDGGTPSVEVVQAALDAALGASPETSVGGSQPYEVGLLLDYMERAGVAAPVIAGYEWSFFSLLEHQRRPRALYAALAEDPEAFADLVTRVYRPRSERNLPSERVGEEALATHAWSVLHDWDRVPGSGEDGRIDARQLRAWVRRARFVLSDRDRAAVGDQQVGQVLARASSDDKGIWPPEPVRDLLEDLASRDVEIGLVVGRYNARGVTMRGPYDGGALERAEAAQYREWARAVTDLWPRTSRLLQELADDYERDARREDAEAQRHANEL